MVQLTIVDLVSLAVAFGGLAFGVAAWVRSGMTPQQVDVNASNRLEEMRKDREHMAAMEKAYSQAGDFQRRALDTMAGVLATVAPLTKHIKFDDVAAEYLKDVQQEGAPEPAKTTGELQAVSKTALADAQNPPE